MAEVSEIEAGGEVRTVKDATARQGVVANATAITEINEKIPSTASASNKMATLTDIASYNELSNAQSITLPTTARYDGVLSIMTQNGGYISFTINSKKRGVFSTTNLVAAADFIIKKGDEIGLTVASGTYSLSARWYKKR